jgi:hypothetical protein
MMLMVITKPPVVYPKSLKKATARGINLPLGLSSPYPMYFVSVKITSSYVNQKSDSSQHNWTESHQPCHLTYKAAYSPL